jgi:hypothetical protein
MESGKTYTENELGEKEYLEKEIRIIFFRNSISDVLVKVGNRLLEKWKNLVEWQEDDIPFLKENDEK